MNDLISNQYQLDYYTFFAESCQRSAQCPAQTFCYPSLGCINLACNQYLGCGFDHECIQPALSQQHDNLATGICAQNCASNDDCRAHERCKILNAGLQVCMDINDANRYLSESCTAHNECADDLACVEFAQAAYCLQGYCDERSVCTADQTCVAISNKQVCLLNCDQQACSTGLTCTAIEQSNICVPQ